MRYILPVLLSLLVTSTFGQVETKPKTKLESFIVQDGVIIIQGFTTVGILKGQYSSQISIDSKEFTNLSSGKKESGITIEVKKLGSIERESTSYVDYDEIESLVKGLDYIEKVDKTVTKLENFQAEYRTRGDLELTTFSTDVNKEGRMFAVKSGKIGSVTAYFKIEDAAKVRELILSAKRNLDSLKQ